MANHDDLCRALEPFIDGAPDVGGRVRGPLPQERETGYVFIPALRGEIPAAGERRWPTADAAFADACRIWLSGCSCSRPGDPQSCPDCTSAFLDALLERARDYKVPMGQCCLPTREEGQ